MGLGLTVTQFRKDIAWLLNQRGHPLRSHDTSKERQILQAVDSDAPMVSRGYVKNFLERHNLSLHEPLPIVAEKASASNPEVLSDFFNKLKSKLDGHPKVRFLVNADETMVLGDKKLGRPKKIIGSKKGPTRCYKRRAHVATEHVSMVLVTYVDLEGGPAAIGAWTRWPC
jgi:hypothetical protein